MKWTTVMLVLVITLLYIPMTFLAVNVLYEEPDYQFTEPCRLVGEEPQPDCVTKDRELNQAYQEERKAVQGQKYVALAIINLAVLLLAFFVPLDVSVIIGLFLGSSLATVIATIAYQDSRSKLGLGVLVALFVLVIIFISKKKKMFSK
jgi:hypothetical protein